MSICGACGTAAPAEGASFCFSCGNALSDPGCAACGSELPAGARFCLNCGAPQTPRAVRPVAPSVLDLTPKGAARKITSVLFGDLVGFTALSESRDAEEVRELLSAYFDECRAVVDRYGGELEKFIGDAVMAVWGLPATREDDAERAVRAGMELVERVQALGERIGMTGLNMRVGITTAEVAVNLGVTGQGMVAGDPVNTAARIQSAATPGQVWVDDTTRLFTSSAIAFDDAGSHSMKGKTEPVPLWSVRAVVASVGGARRDDGLEGQFIGRERELRVIKEFFHQVQETLRPGMLVVDGEPGVGKSRLDWEFEKYIDGLETSVLWHRGRCLSYGEGVAYYALAEAVRSRLSIMAGAVEAAEEDGRQLLGKALVACVPDAGERSWLEPRIAALLGMETGGSFPREDLFVAWTAFFKYVGLGQTDQGQPVVLVIDDAQYADDGLLAFLEHLLAAADYPIYVLVLARPELLAEHPGLVGNRRITVVHLEPLSLADMTTLLNKLVAGVPEAILSELVARAEGIPLYAIETVRSLVDQDLVVARDGRYVLLDPGALDLTALSAPASLQALIAARLDTLPAEERFVVDRASVLGLVFTVEGITALCGGAVDLDAALAGLSRREVIRRETDRFSADFGDYRFVQGAVRQVAYGMLSRRDRKSIHLTVARAFERELMDRNGSEELAPVIAQHYLDAIDAVPGDPDVVELTQTASDHLERAADRAAGLGAPAEAAAHLEKALTRCAPERRLAVQSKLAGQLRISGDYEKAIDHASAALAAYEEAGDLLAAAGVAVHLVRGLAYQGLDDGLERADRIGRDLLDRLADTPETLSARTELVGAIASVVTRAVDPQGSDAIAQLQSKLAERLRDPALIADAWIGLGLSALINGQPALGVVLLERAKALADQCRALRASGMAVLNLTGCTAFLDLEKSIRYGREAQEAGRRLGEEMIAQYASMNLAYAVLFAGAWDEFEVLAAADDLPRMGRPELDVGLLMIAHARGEDSPPLSVVDAEGLDRQTGRIHRAALAFEALSAGRTEEAVRLALESVGDPDDFAGGSDEFNLAWLVASEVVRLAGDTEALTEVLTVVREGSSPWPTGVLAQRQRLTGYLGQAGSLSTSEVESAYAEALDLVNSWGSVVFEAHICADYGSWLIGEGRKDEGGALLARARQIYAELDASAWSLALDHQKVVAP